MVLDVAGPAARSRRLDVDVLLALELGQDLAVGPAAGMRLYVEPATVRHPDQRFPRAAAGRDLEHLVEHRDQDVEALDREALLPKESLVEVGLERLDLGQAAQDPELLLR